LLLFLLVVVGNSDGRRPRDPSSMFYVEPSVGQAWPKPQSIQTTPQQFALDSRAFHFLVNSTSQSCDLLTSALDRYYKLIFFPQLYLNHILSPELEFNEKQHKPKGALADLSDASPLKRLNIHIQQPCDQWPSLESDESCKRRRIYFYVFIIYIYSFCLTDTLTITGDNGMLESVSVWGAIRGLETFSQIIYEDDQLGVKSI
jgi:hexosaminidase